MNIICFSDIHWDYIWQRHQQLLTRFPKSWKILYIQPFSLKTLICHPKCLFPKRINNVLVYSVPRFYFFENKKVTRKINDSIMLSMIKIVNYIYNIKNPVLIFYEPRYAKLMGQFGEKLVLYEYIDNRLGFTEVPRWMENYIKLLIEKADIVTASSDNLYENALASRANNVFLVKNAADIEHFRYKSHVVPIDIKYLKKPIIGYVGAIYEWFDYDLIGKVAENFPDCTVLLIGPIHHEQKDEISMLKKYNNIYFTGKKLYSELPGYINQFDVAIIPFKINDLTKYVNPVKIYEYFASNKPVVCTALPDILEFKDVIYIAKDHEEFLHNIKLALEHTQKPDEYIDILKNNNWNRRAEQMIDIIKKNSMESV